MRIDSVSTSLVNTKIPAPIKRDASAPSETTAPTTATTRTSKGKAHGVIRKLGTDHYSPTVEAKLTARFAPERLVLAPTTDPTTDPATDPTADPSIDPQIIPSDEIPTDLVPLTENELTTNVQLGGTQIGDADSTDAPSRDTTVTRELASAFANFSLFDITQPTRIDLIG
jgi:hypothetical protein